MSAKPLEAYALAKRIVRLLPGPHGWAAKGRRESNGQRSEAAAELKRSVDGAAIDLSIDRFKNRIEFRPRWPEYRDGRSRDPADCPPITCSATRDAGSLARELQRRLLNRYEVAYPLACEQARASNAAAIEAWTTAKKLAKLARGAIDRYGAVRNDLPVKVFGGSAIRGFTVHPASQDHGVRVSLEVVLVDAKTARYLITRAMASRSSE